MLHRPIKYLVLLFTSTNLSISLIQQTTTSCFFYMFGVHLEPQNPLMLSCKPQPEKVLLCSFHVIMIVVFVFPHINGCLAFLKWDTNVQTYAISFKAPSSQKYQLL